MKYARPSQLRILGRNYSVVYNPHFTNYGECTVDEQSIVIRDGQAHVEEADTLLHEAMHAVWALMDIGYSDVEEHVIRKLATGLTLVLKDNPQLLTYLSTPEACALLKPPRKPRENSPDRR